MERGEGPSELHAPRDNRYGQHRLRETAPIPVRRPHHLEPAALREESGQWQAQLALESRLSTCGVCGAGFITAGRNRLVCFGAREKGTCDNRLTISRDEVEARVLKAFHEKL